MRIEVRQEHIDKGERDRCTSCPVALALNDAGFKGAAVTFAMLNLSFYLTVPTPPKAAEWITQFDNGDTVAPFDFELEMPSA
jgi:hypothetical protein